MIDAVMIACIVHQLGGEPANQCYAHKPNEVFVTYNQCRRWANEEEINLAYEMYEETGVISVVQITCGDKED